MENRHVEQLEHNFGEDEHGNIVYVPTSPYMEVLKRIADAEREAAKPENQTWD